MIEVRYPLGSLVKDYLIGLLGLAAIVNILTSLEPGSGLFWFFLALGLFDGLCRLRLSLENA